MGSRASTRTHTHASNSIRILRYSAFCVLQLPSYAAAHLCHARSLKAEQGRVHGRRLVNHTSNASDCSDGATREAIDKQQRHLDSRQSVSLPAPPPLRRHTATRPHPLPALTCPAPSHRVPSASLCPPRPILHCTRLRLDRRLCAKHLSDGGSQTIARLGRCRQGGVNKRASTDVSYQTTGNT